MNNNLKIKISIDKDTGRVKTITNEFGGLDQKIKSAQRSTYGFTNSLIGIGAGVAGLYTVNKALSDIVETGMQLESMTMSLEAAVGGTTQAKKSLEFLKTTANELGLSFKASIDGFSQFAAAAKQTSLEGAGVRDIFTGVAKASAVMGLSVDDQNGVFRALSQMMSKGKIAAEELRGQLGERLPGAFQIASRAMGMSTSELDKFMSSGKLLSEDFLPKFAKQLEKEMGENAVKASHTARASQNRFNNSLLEMKVAINDSGIKELTKDFYDFGVGIAEVTTKNIPEIMDVSKQILEIGASLAVAGAAMKSYTSINAIAASTNVMLGGSFGVVNRSIILATASTRALSLATKAIPYVALASGIYALSKSFYSMISNTSLAEQAMTGYADSIRDASKATLDFEASKITKELARVSKLANDEARKRGANTPVSGYGETLAYELTQLSQQLDVINKQKEAIKKRNNEESTKPDSAVNTVPTQQDALKNIHANTYNDYIKNLLAWEQEDKAENERELQRAIGLNDAKLQAHSQYIQIVGTEEEKFQDKLAQQMSALGESGVLTAEQLKTAYAKLQGDHNVSITSSGMDKALESSNSLIDAQISLAESGMNWGNSLDGVAKKLENVSKSTSMLYVSKLKYQKADDKLQNEYAKKYLAANGNELKQKEIMSEFDKKQSKLKESYKSAEINAYANLAGAMSGFYKEGSDGAEAFQAVQATLGIVNGITAIQGAWASGPFPTNLPAVAATTASVLPMIAQLSSLGGSGSAGGGSVQVPDYSKTIENANYGSQYKQASGTSLSDYGGNFDKFIEGLDSASKKLEAFGNVGSALRDSLTKLIEAKNSTTDLGNSYYAKADSYKEADGKVHNLINVYEYRYYLKLANEQQAKLDKINNEIGKRVTDELSGSLDFSNTSVLQAKDILDNFDLSGYQAMLDELNSLAIKAKANGGDLSSEDFATVTNDYLSELYKKGQDYKDLIDIINEASKTSKANIKSWKDSFKTPTELAQDMANNLGVNLATSLTSLSDLFNQLAYDSDGLTDSEKTLLDANKALLDNNSKALTDAWLGQYSPLTMLQKADYSNAVANNLIPSTATASEKALQALQSSYATATTDEQYTRKFNEYIATLDTQEKDSTRTDIVNEIRASNDTLNDVVDRLERLEQGQAI